MKNQSIQFLLAVAAACIGSILTALIIKGKLNKVLAPFRIKF